MDARVIALVTNIPGPLAASRLAAMGAHVVKVEPERGDPLAAAALGWYTELTKNLRVVRADLKGDGGRVQLGQFLASADLLLTAMRASSLERLGLGWAELHRRFPDLCHIAILGEAYPNDDRAGHDLTYQARAALLTPPSMPKTLFADLFAAERAVSAALRALYERDRSGIASRCDVSIAEGAAMLLEPARYGLTGAGEPLSGARPNYRLYRASDGWIALAALETHFLARITQALELQSFDAAVLEARFAEHSCAHWERIAAEHDLPLATVATIAAPTGR